MSRDDHIDDLPVSPDDPADPAEVARAASFAESIDKLIAGEKPAPAMASEERALVEFATIVRACVHEEKLDTGRRDQLIDGVLAGKLGRVAPPRLTAASAPENETTSPPAPGLTDGSDTGPGGAEGIDDLGARRRSRWQKLVPWTVATVAAAAALVLLIERNSLKREAPEIPQPRVSLAQRSRPADALIGRIPKEHAGLASERLDIIYADRMAGYRELRFRGGRQ